MPPIKKLIYTYAIPAVGRLFNSKNRYVNVIYYHDVVDGEGFSFMRTNFEVFRKQMEYIARNGYETLRFDDLKDESKETFGRKRVIIAFDDGWKSNYTKIYDLMKSLGLKYNIFLAVSEIGKNPDYLTWDEVRKMYTEGMVGFGAHTFSHPDMSDITKIDPDKEFRTADEVFERELGFRPLDFCYPYGAYSQASNEYIEQHTDYRRIYTSNMMYSYEEGGKIVFGRNGISNDEAFCVFRGKLRGYYNVWKMLLG